MDAFITWYNTKHVHSGIGYVTPEQKHAGQADAIIAHRNETKRRAYEAHKNRWSRPLSLLTTPQVVYLNPSLETRQKMAANPGERNCIHDGVLFFSISLVSSVGLSRDSFMAPTSIKA
ncbi:MAG: transposase [Microcoleus sp. SM1_3_4]|nr:transposase [Microcoleus sp. SM1_3_4]